MSRFDELPPDQRAAVSVLLRGDKRYDEVAAMLGIAARAVHDRAHAALAVLAPREARALDAASRELIGDYLLGQQRAVAERLQARTLLAGSAGANAWARAIAAELAAEAPAGLPEIPALDTLDTGTAPAGEGRPASGAPTGEAPPAVGATAPAPGPAGQARPAPAPAGEQPPAARPGPAPRTVGAPSSRLGGALLLVVIVAAVVVAVVLLTEGGGEKKHAPGTGASASAGAAGTSTETSTGTGTSGGTGSTGSSGGTGSTGTSTGTGSTGASGSTGGTSASGAKAKVIATLTLKPESAGSRSTGSVKLLAEGSTKAFFIEAERIPSTNGFFYAVWLYNSATSALPLSKAPSVGASHKLSGAALLPSNAGEYHEILLTQETSTKPTHPGRVVLRAPFSLSGG